MLQPMLLPSKFEKLLYYHNHDHIDPVGLFDLVELAIHIVFVPFIKLLQ